MGSTLTSKSKNQNSGNAEKSSQDILNAIQNVQALDIFKAEIKSLFEEMLENCLSISDSEYGFIGKLLVNEQGQQYLQTLAVTNIAWNEETRKLYKDNIDVGLKFYNLNTLFGQVLLTGEPVISNDPANDPRRGGLAHGHPPLNAFMGLPLHSGNKLIGMVGLANRKGGYDEEIVSFLQPLLAVCSLFVISQANLQQRQEAEEALRISEERLKLALDGSSDGLWDWNVETGEVYFSPRWMTMLGYEPFELEGHVKTWESLVHPEDLHETQGTLKNHFEGKGPYQIQFRMRTKNGNWMWILARGKVVERDASEKPLRMVGTHTDITEMKGVQDKLKHATEEAEKANRFKSEFLSQMSHELRTPLNAILGFGQILQTSSNLDPDQVEDTDNIVQAGEHLLDLINQILDLSAIESGKMAIIIKPISIDKVVSEVFRLLQPLAETMEVTLHKQQKLQDLNVQSDPLRLIQVLTNLVSNAIKYNKVGGDVFVKWNRLSARHCALTVVDTGCGISLDQQKKIFTSFYRCKEHSSDIQGTGIGLSLSKELIGLMSGEIDVESTPGKGSQFTITLPTAIDQNNLSGESAAPGENFENPGNMKQILYIEDNMQNLRLVQQVFKKHTDYKIFHASTASTGLDLAKKLLPDVIILDIRLPDKDGFAAFAELRSISETSSIPVIALSAEAMPDMVQQGKDLGFKAYITKPFKVSEFLSTIKNHIS